MIIERDTCELAIERYGADIQIEHSIEEMGELIVAIMELKRNRGERSGKVDAVIDEIADVSIMMHQLALIFGETAVQARIEKKITRLKIRLYENQEH